MASSIRPLYKVVVLGVVGFAGALGVIRLTRAVRSFWFRPPAQRRVITNGQPERATPTPVTGSDFSPGESPTSGGNHDMARKIEQLKTSLDEIIGQLQQEKNALELEVVRLHRLLEEKTRTLPEANTSKGTSSSVNLERERAGVEARPLQGGETFLQQCNENVDDIDSSKESTGARGRKPGNGHRTSRDSHTGTQREQLHKPIPPVDNKSDLIFVVDGAELVRILNASILQASSLIADSLPHRESPFSSKELEDASNELICYIGPWLCNVLRSQSKESSTEPDLLITQIALHAGLLNACNHIVNNGIPPSGNATLFRTHSDMLDVSQAVTDAWTAQSYTYGITSQSGAWEINWKYVAGITCKLIAAVGGSLKSGEALPPQYCKVVDEIVKISLDLHKAIREGTASMIELVTYSVPCDAIFDPSRMEDTEGSGNETGLDTVICTMEMGLQCRKRNESGSSEEWVVAKAKVVLRSTLEV